MRLLLSPALLSLAVALAWPAAGAPAGGVLLAQAPAQTTPQPRAGDPPDWQRPDMARADYVAEAKRALDGLAARLTELKQRANERGAREALQEMQEAERRLQVAREHWDKLPQADQANWDTVRKSFEMAYADLMRAWREVPRTF